MNFICVYIMWHEHFVSLYLSANTCAISATFSRVSFGFARSNKHALFLAIDANLCLCGLFSTYANVMFVTTTEQGNRQLSQKCLCLPFGIPQGGRVLTLSRKSRSYFRAGGKVKPTWARVPVNSEARTIATAATPFAAILFFF